MMRQGSLPPERGRVGWYTPKAEHPGWRKKTHLVHSKLLVITLQLILCKPWLEISRKVSCFASVWTGRTEVREKTATQNIIGGLWIDISKDIGQRRKFPKCFRPHFLCDEIVSKESLIGQLWRDSPSFCFSLKSRMRTIVHETKIKSTYAF